MSPAARWTKGASAPRDPNPGGHTLRDQAVDVAKGIAILAIVVSHVLRGLAAAHLVHGTSAGFLALDGAMYSFHIVAFAVLAGVFVRPSVQRVGASSYLTARLALLAYLYVLWTAIEVLVALLSARVVNSPLDLRTAELSLLIPYGQMWWFGFLALATVGAVAVRPWVSVRRAGMSSVVVAIVALLAWGWTGPYVFTQGLALLIFFWAGVLGGQHVLRVFRHRCAPLLALLSISLGGVLFWRTTPMPPTSWHGARSFEPLILGVLATCALTAGVLALATALSRTRLAAPFAALGRRSLEIFLAHIIAMAGMRIVLVKLGIDHVGMHLVLGTVAGIALPLALWRLGRLARFPWLFQLPRRLSSKGPHAARVRA